MQQFPPIIIACGINLYGVSLIKFSNVHIQLDFQSLGGKLFSSVISLVLLIGSLVSLPVMWIVIRRGMRMQQSDREQFDIKCGSLIDGLRANSNAIAAFWNLLTLIRWTLTTAILIFLKDLDEFQILSMLIISVIYSALLIRGKPFDDSFDNKMSLFTECIVSVYLYMLLCLTDFTGQGDLIREPLALTLVYVIGFAVFVNLMIFAKYGFFKLKGCIERRIKAREKQKEQER